MGDSFTLQDSNGNKYKAIRVAGRRVETNTLSSTRHEHAGLPSYQLADGRVLNINDDGEVVTFTIVESGTVLTRAD